MFEEGWLLKVLELKLQLPWQLGIASIWMKQAKYLLQIPEPADLSEEEA